MYRLTMLGLAVITLLGELTLLLKLILRGLSDTLDKFINLEKVTTVRYTLTLHLMQHLVLVYRMSNYQKLFYLQKVGWV